MVKWQLTKQYTYNLSFVNYNKYALKSYALIQSLVKKMD